VPILVRHETVAPIAEAAAGAGQFDAQRQLNDEQFRWQQADEQNRRADAAMAQDADQFQQRLAAASAEENAERMFRESMAHFEAGQHAIDRTSDQQFRNSDREDDQQFRGQMFDREAKQRTSERQGEEAFRSGEAAKARDANDRRNRENNAARTQAAEARGKYQMATAGAKASAAAAAGQQKAQSAYYDGLMKQAKIEWDAARQEGRQDNMDAAAQKWKEAQAGLNGVRLGGAMGGGGGGGDLAAQQPQQQQQQQLPVGVAAPQQLPTAPVPAAINSPEDIHKLPREQKAGLAKRRAMQILQTLPPDYTPAKKKQAIANALIQEGFDLNEIGAL
jgi:hypothetical protein